MATKRKFEVGDKAIVTGKCYEGILKNKEVEIEGYDGPNYRVKVLSIDRTCWIHTKHLTKVCDNTYNTIQTLIETKENVVVHCPTEELAKQVLTIFHNAGLTWDSGASYIRLTNWENYKQDTAYYPNEGAYCDLSWVKYREKLKYRIIKAEDFLAANTITEQIKPEIKVMKKTRLVSTAFIQEAYREGNIEVNKLIKAANLDLLPKETPVDESLIIDCYKLACQDWKTKLQYMYPDLLVKKDPVKELIKKLGEAPYSDYKVKQTKDYVFVPLPNSNDEWTKAAFKWTLAFLEQCKDSYVIHNYAYRMREGDGEPTMEFEGSKYQKLRYLAIKL
jgi:hypothetical protein